MEPTISSALIGAGSNAIQGIGNAIFGNATNKRNLRYQKKLADYTYSKDLEMWNTQNEYNSPANQMKRFREGGLNTNLMYGQGNAGNASQLPKYQAPTGKVERTLPQIGGTLDSYMDVKLKQAQIDNVKANTESADASTALKAIDEEYRRIRNRYYPEKEQWNIANLQRTNEGLGYKNYGLKFGAETTRIRNKYEEASILKKLESMSSTITRNAVLNSLSRSTMERNNILNKFTDTQNLLGGQNIKKAMEDVLIKKRINKYGDWQWRMDTAKGAVGTITNLLKTVVPSTTTSRWGQGWSKTKRSW